MIHERSKFFIQNFVATHYVPFLLYTSVKPKLKTLRVEQDTEIVIEGFPRSGNTFAVLAFKIAQNRKMKIAHHLHSEMQIRLARNWNIPTLILIREPIDAISSLLVRRPDLSISPVVNYYINFHKTILKHQTHIVVADFKTVISNFASIIERINQKYQTAFACYNNSTPIDESIFRSIELLNARQEQGLVTSIAIPAPEKDVIKTAIASRVCEYSRLQEANELFETLRCTR